MDRLPHLNKVLPLLLLLVTTNVAMGRVEPELRHAARLQAAETAQCWEWMTVLQSCSGEVILFFLNGETYLGPACCRAIRVIESQCWAAEMLLAALGFTAEEGDILRGYCDAAVAAPPAASLSSRYQKPETHN